MLRSRSLAPLLALVALLLALPFAPRTLQAAEAAWKVLFNGAPSKTQVLEGEGGACVPVAFPVEPGQTTWEVTLKVDPAGRTVQIVRERKGAARRGEEKCPICSGDGDCHSCYPVASGLNTSGAPCSNCNGTGECDFCRGTGKR